MGKRRKGIGWMTMDESGLNKKESKMDDEVDNKVDD